MISKSVVFIVEDLGGPTAVCRFLPMFFLLVNLHKCLQKEAVEIYIGVWSMWWARHPYIESAIAL